MHSAYILIICPQNLSIYWLSPGMQGVPICWPGFPLGGSAPGVQLLVGNLPTRGSWSQPWNMELCELSQQLVCCSSPVFRAAMWYFMHTDNHIITANTVKGTSLAQHCRVGTLLNNLSYYTTKKCCSCLLTGEWELLLHWQAMHEEFFHTICISTFSTNVSRWWQVRWIL